MSDAPYGIRRWQKVPLTVAVCFLAGICTGALTNAVNGCVSPGYYRAVLRWYSEDWQTWVGSIGQGVVEGGALGLAFGVVLTLAAGASCRFQCSFQLILKALGHGLAIALTCWGLGGLVGLAWATIDPQSFTDMVILASGLDGPHLRGFAWVGGSIDGAYAGAALGLVRASLYVHRQWRAGLLADRSGFPVVQAYAPTTVTLLSSQAPFVVTGASASDASPTAIDHGHSPAPD